MFFQTPWTYRYDFDLWHVSKGLDVFSTSKKKRKSKKKKEKWIDKRVRTRKKNSDKVRRLFVIIRLRCAWQINPLTTFHFARFDRCFLLCTSLCILWPPPLGRMCLQDVSALHNKASVCSILIKMCHKNRSIFHEIEQSSFFSLPPSLPSAFLRRENKYSAYVEKN